MMLLPDGDVLAQRGEDSTGTVTGEFYLLAPDAQGNYQLGAWSDTGSFDTPRLYYGSNILPNGEVFAIGGEYSGSPPQQNHTDTSVIYNVQSGVWTAAAPIPLDYFGDDPTELLADGQVLAGNIGPLNSHDNEPYGAAYLFTPGAVGSAGTWAQTGTKFHADDQSDEESWVLLPDGSVLSYAIFSSALDNTFEADRYIPSTGQWVNASNLSTSNQPHLLSCDRVGDELGAALLLSRWSRFPNRRGKRSRAEGPEI